MKIHTPPFELGVRCGLEKLRGSISGACAYLREVDEIELDPTAISEKYSVDFHHPKPWEKE